MNVRDALANSYNIPVVQVISNVGIGQVIRLSHQLGINSLNGSLDQYGLALALGSGEVSLLDLTYAYTVFATLGSVAGTPVQNPRAGYRAYDPVAVLRIDDKDGNARNWTTSATRSDAECRSGPGLSDEQHPLRQTGAAASLWQRQCAGAVAPGGSQDRHDQR
jgi:membrane carboxypeptidase/penicillin-binding protein